MKTLKNLLNTIKNNSINNKCIITNVDLFVSSWQREMDAELLQSRVVGQSEQLKCGNPNPPCSPNIKFGMLECCNCEWGE